MTRSRKYAWLSKWKEWEGDRGVDVENWNRALNAIWAVNGLAFKKDMGQVYYRSDIVDAVGDLLRNMSEQCEVRKIRTHQPDSMSVNTCIDGN